MMWICPQDAVTNYPLLNYQMELANLQKARERTEEFLPFEHVSRAPTAIIVFTCSSVFAC